MILLAVSFSAKPKIEVGVRNSWVGVASVPGCVTTPHQLGVQQTRLETMEGTDRGELNGC